MMARPAKKTAKKTAKKKKNRAAPRRGLRLLALLLLVGVSLAIALFLIFFHRPDQGHPPQPALPQLSTPAKKAAVPAETAPAATPGPAEPARTQEPATAAPKPLVAIVIDDMGYQQATGRELLDLDLNLTFAFLPFSPGNPPLLARAMARGREILLHLPMESDDPDKNPGPGSLRTDMDAATLREELGKNLQEVPEAIGVNNHMGSRFTADAAAMRRFLPALAAHDLFFLDSLTSPASTGHRLAAEMGIQTVRRDIFLDNEQVPEKIISQLELLVKIAGKNGRAVAIGHPYPATLEALRRYKNELLSRVELVGISRLVR
jgi:hypothetical protein